MHVFNMSYQQTQISEKGLIKRYRKLSTLSTYTTTNTATIDNI